MLSEFWVHRLSTTGLDRSKMPLQSFFPVSRMQSQHFQAQNFECTRELLSSQHSTPRANIVLSPGESSKYNTFRYRSLTNYRTHKPLLECNSRASTPNIDRSTYPIYCFYRAHRANQKYIQSNEYFKYY